MFAFWSVAAIQSERRRTNDERLPLFFVSAIVMVILIGLRDRVGTDWPNYLEIYDNISLLTLRDSLGASDPGYGLLNWLAAYFGFGIGFVNLVCGAVFFGGFAYLAWRQPNPALAVVVAIPYLIIVVAMGYTRQAAAIGFLCFAIADATERNLVRIVILIGLAALFHRTAILMLPVMLTPILLKNYLLGVFGVAMFIILFLLILRSSTDNLINQYVTSSYDSQGAAIRISMNVIASVTFFAIYKKIEISDFQKTYWTATAVLSILSVVALASASASSGVDRFSLYMIPIQPLVYSQLPYVVSKNGRAVPSLLLMVIAYSFCIQFVWLFYADNAQSWLPYKNLLWRDPGF
jgi:hypothetical protein